MSCYSYNLATRRFILFELFNELQWCEASKDLYENALDLNRCFDENELIRRVLQDFKPATNYVVAPTPSRASIPILLNEQ